MEKTLSLTIDGRITYCSSPKELRGTGRCNHVAHQENDESQFDFIKRISTKIKDDENKTVAEELEITSKEEVYSVKNMDNTSMSQFLGL